MKEKIDPTQYGNQQKTSIYHYLLKMINRIVTSMDKNLKQEKYAVLATFWIGNQHTLNKTTHLENDHL